MKSQASILLNKSVEGVGEKGLDGLNIMELDVCNICLDHQQLDLSVKEIQVALQHLGPQASGQVLNVSGRGKHQVSFVSDTVSSMAAAGLKRDAIVILRMDGEDLLEFINGPNYEPYMISIFSQIDMVHDYITKALQHLTVEHGMPPLSDSWVVSNIVEPALQPSLNKQEKRPLTQELMLEEFKIVVQRLAQLLKEQPVIVAHSEQTFDGSGIRRLLSNKFEYNKTLEIAISDFEKDDNGKVSKEYLSVALGLVGPSAGLPLLEAINQVDVMVKEAIQMKMVEGDDRKMIEKEELKKLVTEVLESIMLQLEENPILVSSNVVVHEPLSSPSTPEQLT